MATYKDIREMTGLSLATISKYFNGRNVLDENRTAIEQAAQQLGYRINTVASNLRSGRSRTVGVLLPSLANEFHMSIVANVESALQADGISVIVTSTHDHNGDQHSVDLLLGRMVDVIVAVPTPEIVVGLRSAIAAGVPVICFDWSETELASDRVTLHNKHAGKLAARHLVDHGHCRIGLISGAQTISTMHDRTLGFLRFLDASGADASPELFLTGPLTVAQGHAAMRSLLELDERPSAVFTVNYELTVGALIALNESGLRLGEDVSLLGFDNTDLARVTQPRLTVIAQPIAEIGQAVAELVRHRLAATSPAPLIDRQLRAHVVAGASVAPLHRSSAKHEPL